jgi:hypothetical protein
LIGAGRAGGSYDHIAEVMCLLSLRLYTMLSFNYEFCTTFITHCSRYNGESPNGLYEGPLTDITPASSRGFLATRSAFPRITTSEIVLAEMPHIITFCQTHCTSSCNRLWKDPCYDSPSTLFSQQDSYHCHTFEIAAARSCTLKILTHSKHKICPCK